MDEISQLKQRLEALEGILSVIVHYDRYISQKHIQLLDGRDIQFGQSIGTKLGIATTDKSAFHGVTPVVQRSGAAQASVATTASTQTTPWGYASQAQADAIVTLVNELRATLVEKGLAKGSA